MASPGPDEEFGDLFDYDIEDIEATGLGTAESETRPTEKSTVQGPSSRRAEDGDDVGGLVEVKLPSRRNKVKLDEARLLGPMGIPYIRKNAPQRIKFKGKRHEIGDLGRLLEFYQIWANGLYPKAQFKDVIKIVDKLGASRNMQSHRHGWMEEFRLQQAEEDARLLDKAKATMAMPTSDHETPQVSTYEDAIESQAQISGSEGVTRPDSLFFQNADDETDSGPEEDEMAALIREAEELQGAITSMENEATDGRKEMSRSVVGTFEGSDDEFEEAMKAMREVEN